jgi:hypothetical protein
MREWRLITIMGMLLLAGGNGLVVGEQWVPSNQAALLVATTALWLAGFGTHGVCVIRLAIAQCCAGVPGHVCLRQPCCRGVARLVTAGGNTDRNTAHGHDGDLDGRHHGELVRVPEENLMPRRIPVLKYVWKEAQ